MHFPGIFQALELAENFDRVHFYRVGRKLNSKLLQY